MVLTPFYETPVENEHGIVTDGRQRVVMESTGSAFGWKRSTFFTHN